MQSLRLQSRALRTTARQREQSVAFTAWAFGASYIAVLGLALIPHPGFAHGCGVSLVLVSMPMVGLDLAVAGGLWPGAEFPYDARDSSQQLDRPPLLNKASAGLVVYACGVRRQA